MKVARTLFFLLLSIASINALAYDIAVKNEDGVTIYYEINDHDDSELAVAPQHVSWEPLPSGSKCTYNSDYNGDIRIPKEVSYEGVLRKVTSIADGAFYNCDVESVKIPNTVTSIGNAAFYGCSHLDKVIVEDIDAWFNIEFVSESSSPFYGLLYSGRGRLYNDEGKEITNLVVPDCVTKINDYAFYGCKGLVSVITSNNVTSIGKKAFYNNDLKSVTIGTGVLSIGNNAFFGDGPKKVIWLTNTPPERYENAEGKVNYVANDLYSKLKNKKVYKFLSSLFVVGGVKYVPISPSERTCEAIDCIYDESAEEVHIGETVTNQGISLTVKQVCDYACYGNKNIKDVNLGFDGDIGSYAFYGCENINSLVVNNKGGIGESAFSGITSDCNVVINNVGVIGEKAFYVSTGVKTLEIGSSVTNIYESAFESCSGLQTAQISNKGSISDKAFRYCSSLQTATLGENVTSIGKSAFSGCSSLSNIVIPNAVQTLGSYAFENCSSMQSAKIGSGVKAINEYTFSKCTSLVDLQIGANVDIIDTYAFEQCSSLPLVCIPQSVSNINNAAFYGCSNLNTVIMDDGKTELTLASNYKSYKDYSNPLFSDCPLDSVYIGRNISYSTDSKDGYSPFYRNTSLRAVRITDEETEISENEFYGCSGLKNVYIGDGVTTIGNWAFSGCSSLDYFAFGSGLKSIGDEAFSDCVNVTKIISKVGMPPTCGSQALDDINKWTCTLYVPNGKKEVYQDADQWKEFFFVEDTNADAVEVNGIYYHLDKNDKVAEVVRNPNDYKGSIVIPEKVDYENVTYTVTSIGEGAFSNSQDLTSISIPNSVTSIKGSAFLGCSNLTSVYSNIENPFAINSHAFYGVAADAKLRVPLGTKTKYEGIEGWNLLAIYESGEFVVDDIHYTIYDDNVWVTDADPLDGDIVIPSQVAYLGTTYSVVGIGPFVFGSGVTSVTIPKSVTTMNGNAFSGCSSLTAVYIKDLTAWCNIYFMDDDANPLEWAHRLFLNGEEIKDLVIPEGVTSIKRYAFRGCSGLTSVTLPNSVTSIARDAFTGCSGLKSITIPNSITRLDRDAFDGCTGLTTIFSEIENPFEIDSDVFYGVPSDAALVVPQGTKAKYEETAGWNQFSNIVEISGKCGQNVYYSYDRSNKTLAIYGEGEMAQFFAKILSPVDTRPWGPYLDEIYTVNIESGVTNVGSAAFALCHNLTSISIPSTVTLIDWDAFNNCHGLTSITIPNSVVTIRTDAIFNCNSLTDVYCLAEQVPNTEAGAFSSTSVENITLHVPAASIEAYRTTAPWSGFKKIVPIETATEAIVPISSVGQGTFCFDEDLDFTNVSGIRAYVASGFNPATGTILLMHVNEVPAGTGLLVKGNGGSYTVPVKSTSFYYLNMFHPVFEFTTVPEQSGEYTNFVLANGPDGLLFYRSLNATLVANRAYLQIPTSSLGNRSNARAIGLTFDDEDDATGIGSVKDESTEENIYNLYGQRVTTPRKGIFVRNGKKIFIH